MMWRVNSNAFHKFRNPNAEPISLSEGSPSSSSQGSGSSLSSTGENRFPHQDKSSSSSVVSVKPKLIEWPPYDSLFKKFLSIGEFLFPTHSFQNLFMVMVLIEMVLFIHGDMQYAWVKIPFYAFLKKKH